MQQYIDTLASLLHDEWRKPRLLTGVHGQANARYEPRIKPNGDGEVDIANTHYSSLPVKWQDENKAQATAVIQSIINSKTLDIEELSSIVHEQWMQRNSWAQKDQPELFVPYSALPENEKEKDRVVVRQGIKVIHG